MMEKKEPVLTYADIVHSTAGESFSGTRSEGVGSVVADSRECSPGSLFVALPGERTDGHFFIEEALTNGSSLVLLNRRFAEKNKEKISSLAKKTGAGFVVVPDTLRALQELARFHMRRLESVVRVGVTGSSGKTTTKEIVGAILLKAASGFMNRGNLNSEIGLPLSTFSVTRADHYAIFEMGMNHQGEMDVLVDIVRPDVAAITNIGTAHIGLLGSQEAIATEKKKIFACFDGDQTGFIYEDEPFYGFLSRGVRGVVRPYGPRSTPGYRGGTNLGLDGYLLKVGDREARLPLIGIHNLHNALCAVSIADHFGVPLDLVVEGLESVRAISGRGEIVRGPVTIVQDSYNANPEAFERAIDFFDEVAWKGRKIIVAGSMKELGAESLSAHARVGRMLAASSADAVFLFGEEMSAAREAFAARSKPLFFFSDFDELKNEVLSFVHEGDLLMLKASRGMELERLVPDLRKAVQA